MTLFYILLMFGGTADCEVVPRSGVGARVLVSSFCLESRLEVLSLVGESLGGPNRSKIPLFFPLILSKQLSDGIVPSEVQRICDCFANDDYDPIVVPYCEILDPPGHENFPDIFACKTQIWQINGNQSGAVPGEPEDNPYCIEQQCTAAFTVNSFYEVEFSWDEDHDFDLKDYAILLNEFSEHRR